MLFPDYALLSLSPADVLPDDIIESVGGVPVPPTAVTVIVEDEKTHFHEFRGRSRWTGRRHVITASPDQTITVIRKV